MHLLKDGISQPEEVVALHTLADLVELVYRLSVHGQDLAPDHMFTLVFFTIADLLINAKLVVPLL